MVLQVLQDYASFSSLQNYASLWPTREAKQHWGAESVWNTYQESSCGFSARICTLTPMSRCYASSVAEPWRKTRSSRVWKPVAEHNVWPRRSYAPSPAGLPLS